MESESDNLEQKRVTPLSTVSLDSTYDQVETVPESEKRTPRYESSWVCFILLISVVLIAVGLVLALDRNDSGIEVTVDEVDPASYSSLNAPQKKLVGWLKEMRNSSEVYIEGASNNFSLSGVVFPRNDSKTLVSFDALVAVYSGELMPSRQFVALADGKGYQWTETQLGYGDSILSNRCLTNRRLPFHDLESIVKTANWTSDFDDDLGVSLQYDGANYTVFKDEDEYDETENMKCWFIESEEIELGMQICIPSVDEQLSKTDFEGILQAPSGCPQLAPTRSASVAVPLPLRKWYASYKA